MPVPRDCTDGFMAAFWGRPEAYLDPHIRSGTSAWHQLPPAVVTRALGELQDDAEGGNGIDVMAISANGPPSTSADD